MSTAEPEQNATASLSQNGDLEAAISNKKPVEKSVANTSPSILSSMPESNVNNDDKLDELSQLELEMAELDKTETLKQPEIVVNDIPLVMVEKSVDSKKLESETTLNEQKKEKSDDSIQNEMQNLFEATDKQNGGESLSKLPPGLVEPDVGILDHEDLIAVLKGESAEGQANNDEEISKTKIEDSKTPSLPVSSPGDLVIEGVTIEGEGEYQIMEVVDDDFEDELDTDLAAKVGVSTSPNVSKTTNKISGNQKLTPEEVRAMAMEQIAGLNARGPRRRKQDIKPLQGETSELVSTLGADWSDDDEMGMGSDHTSQKPAKNMKTANKEIVEQSQISVPEKNVSGEKKFSITQAADPKKQRPSTAKVTNVIVIKSSNQEAQAVAENENITNEIQSNSSGFKRARTIKRRIIWDPDAPETSFSYANLVRSSSKDNQGAASPAPASKPRPVTPKEKRLKVETTAIEKKLQKRAATPSTLVENLETPSTSKRLRRSQTKSPIPNGSALQSGGKKKKVSEIDRLMGDEGAANMINSLESGRNKTGEDDDNRSHRPLMRSRGGNIDKITKQENFLATSNPNTAAKTKRGPKPKASTSWDFVYKKKQQLSDDSMIIRRRSNSSYSSNASLHRLSLDGPGNLIQKPKIVETSSDDAAENSNPANIPRLTKSTPKAALKSTNSNANNESSPPKVTAKASSGSKQTSPISGLGVKSFEFAKPKETKSNPKPTNRRAKATAGETSTLTNDIKKGVAKRAGPGRPPASWRTESGSQSPVENSLSLSPTSSTAAAMVAASIDADVLVRKVGKIAQIVINTSYAQLNGTFTVPLMIKIVNTLKDLAEDENCNVVAIISNSQHFCQGIDFTNLTIGSLEQRKAAANVLAAAVKNLLKTLATFPKPLIAGIHGTITGLGVTQLPLFDVVIASDKTSFEAPYVKIGQVPEGFCLWQASTGIRETAKTKLFWLAERIHATEASSAGLICKTTTSEKVNEDTINLAKKMGTMSLEAYRIMKNTIIQSRMEAVISSLDEEFEEIVKQWTSVECCNKLKKFIEVGHY